MPLPSYLLVTMKHNNHTLTDALVLKQSTVKPWLFSVIVGRYQKAFLRKSLSILKSQELAEDVVQDTFLKIYKHAEQFSERPQASFRSWAYKILINTCYDEVARRNKARIVQGFDFADLDSMGVVESVVPVDHSYVHVVMSRMPHGLSRFLRLYFFEEKSQKEIAEQEHMTVSAVRSRIHRAKQSFRIVLARESLLKHI